MLKSGNLEMLRLEPPTFRSDLLSVRDTVAQKDYEPKLPSLTVEADEDEEDTVRIIQLMSKEPLGATFKWDASTGAIVVARVMRRGAADRSDFIGIGSHFHIFQAQSDGAVTFKVIPGTKDDLEADDTEVFVWALFDYHSEEDPTILCKDARLEFWRGDELQIVTSLRAGLIPSWQLQQRRVALQRPEVLFMTSRALKMENAGAADFVAIHGIHIAGLKRSFRLSKKDRMSRELQAKWKKCEDDDDDNQISSYREVVPYVRGPGEPNHLVLLVGTHLLRTNSTISRMIAMADIRGIPLSINALLSVMYASSRGRYRSAHAPDPSLSRTGGHGGNYCGTGLDSVRKVLAERKVYLLDVEPQAVKLLYTTEFKPYVTFVKPPAVEQLRLSRRKEKILASCDEPMPTRTFMEADLKDMINTAQEMENKYGYLFEKIIINDDLAMPFTDLRAELKKLEEESNWIARTWAVKHHE
ncbi:LOW QUALITY PROTEIN: MAGUK p55 subfamily member 7 [Clarias gariepinus]